MMFKKLILAALLALGVSSAQAACTTGSLPFNLQNNTVADATQVMANFNQIGTGVSANCAGSGANTDITSIGGLTTPLSQTLGGTWIWVGGTSTGSGNAQVVATVTPATGFGLTQGKRVQFTPGFTNSGATTLNVFGTGAINVFKSSASGPIALTGNEIITNVLTEVIYDGTQYQIVNPTPPVAFNTAGWGLTSSGTTVSFATSNPGMAFTAPVNLQLNASVSTNNLTIAIKGNNGADPSATNPVLIPFKDSTIANGDPVWIALTAATSFQVNSGSTFGVANNIAFKLWIVAFNDASTVRVALFNASTATPLGTTQIFPLNEGVLASSTLCNACGTATALGTFYSTVAVTSKAYRILGYLEYAAGLATAGSFNIVPTTVQLFGPGIKKPGEVIQQNSLFVAAGQGVTGTVSFTVLTNYELTITPTATSNIIKAEASGQLVLAGASPNGQTRWSRGTTNNSGLFGSQCSSLQGTTTSCAFSGFDFPQTTSAQTYAVQAAQTLAGGTTTFGGTAQIAIYEIQG